ncbi:hypothetical protein M5689_013467 [Euphorbia peplus]|nr:hypothetical protein M5689_013467 [Euphorbia peplus]
MKLVVEILTGNLFYIELENDATVADLKREICAQEMLPHDRLILLLNNNRSRLIMNKEKGDDETPLADCGVDDASHIYLFFIPPDDHQSSSSHVLSS